MPDVNNVIYNASTNEWLSTGNPLATFHCFELFSVILIAFLAFLKKWIKIEYHASLAQLSPKWMNVWYNSSLHVWISQSDENENEMDENLNLTGFLYLNTSFCVEIFRICYRMNVTNCKLNCTHTRQMHQVLQVFSVVGDTRSLHYSNIGDKYEKLYNKYNDFVRFYISHRYCYCENYWCHLSEEWQQSVYSSLVCGIYRIKF